MDKGDTMTDKLTLTLQALERAREEIQVATVLVRECAEVAIDAATPDPARDNGFRLSIRSALRLEGVHLDLRAIVVRALQLSPVDFGIPKTGGVRTKDTQRVLLGRGSSKTLRSRHLTGHAVDIYAVDPDTGKASWDARLIMQIHDAFVAAADEQGIKLRWGGDWDEDGAHERGEDDLVHHELRREDYPAGGA